MTDDVTAYALVLDGMLAEAARAGRFYAEIAADIDNAELDLHVRRLERPVPAASRARARTGPDRVAKPTRGRGSSRGRRRSYPPPSSLVAPWSPRLAD